MLFYWMSGPNGERRWSLAWPCGSNPVCSPCATELMMLRPGATAAPSDTDGQCLRCGKSYGGHGPTPGDELPF